MIRPLRARHRLVVSLGLVVLPALVVGAVLARRPVPVATVPPALTRLQGAGVDATWRGRVWASPPTDVSVFRDGERALLLIEPREDPGLPDLLVYRSSAPEAGTELPDDAVLLGRLDGSSPVWVEAGDERGTLILYSLAHQRVVAAGVVGGD